MQLSYDFDMFCVIPQALFDDPKVGPRLRSSGLRPDHRENRVALFRDPATAAAFRRAPQHVQDYLRAAGFGTTTYASGAPPGRYPARDEMARMAVLCALRRLAPRFPLPEASAPRAAPGEFEVREFLMAALDARPYEMAADRRALALAERPDPERVTLSLAGVVGLTVAFGCFLAIPLV